MKSVCSILAIPLLSFGCYYFTIPLLFLISIIYIFKQAKQLPFINFPWRVSICWGQCTASYCQNIIVQK